MISIIIPAHNESSVIGRCLGALTGGSRPDEFEIIVVANGCADDTAAAARAAAPHAKVIETAIASKSKALNLGDLAASRFPRLYMDADVVITAESIRALARALNQPGALAAAPTVNMVFLDRTDYLVRVFFRFWLSLPHLRDGMVTAGAYALTSEGRSRFKAFPDIVSDDGFVRLHFASHERCEAQGSWSEVTAPVTLANLVRIRTRVRLGLHQLKTVFPALFHREAPSKRYLRALASVLARPWLYPGAVVYAWVELVSNLRAAWQTHAMDRYHWERDNSSRYVDPMASRPPEGGVR
jgi:glycosyltransferase involved in cell wall biosynthesis